MNGVVSLLRRPRVLVAGVVASVVWCGVGAERAWASTQTYNAAGSYSFTVPAGVTSVAVTAIAGAGGDCFSATGGEGASVTATVTVAPGEDLVVWVAGAGGSCSGGGGGGVGGGGAGGTGSGGSAHSGGGGGASVVAPGTFSPDFSRALVVAGGGGGAIQGTNGLNGGNAGSPGSDGAASGSGGGAGSQSAGGAGGVAGSSRAAAGSAGSLGVGGVGGEGDTGGPSIGGGGGGSGYYGGGGGGGSNALLTNSGSGGGGSSFVAPGATNVTGPTLSSSAAEVTITYTTTSTSMSAPPSGVAGTAIAASSISGTLSGATGGATGTITFTVFGPQSSPPTDCTNGGTTVGVATVSGSGTYGPSAGYTPPSAGTYYWYASYSGAGEDEASNSGCGTGMESTVVAPIAVSQLDVSPDTLSIAGRKVHGKCVKPTSKNAADEHCLRPIKLTIGYSLNGAATVTFTLRRMAPGRTVNGRCVAPTPSHRHKKRCTRLVNVRGNLVKTGNAGANAFVWNGKIGAHTLAPGDYELTASLADGGSQTVTFTIVG